MRLAIWDYPFADFLVSGFTSGAVPSPFDIERHPPEECAARFVEGNVDVALLPTKMALKASQGIDVIPSVGIVSWKYPFAKLVWKEGLHDLPKTIAYNRRHTQEQFLARVIMHEHYDVDPEFVAYDQASTEMLRSGEQDAALLVGQDVPTLDVDSFTMDVGREWYELVNYPMVWGLLVTKKDRADAEIIKPLIANAEAAEEQREDWIQLQDPPEELLPFYEEELRIRIDRLGIASLTELRTYLFYYEEFDEIPDVPFVYLDDEDEDEEGESTNGRAPNRTQNR